MQREQEAKAGIAVEAARAALAHDAAAIETSVVHGDAADAIVKTADEFDADIVVMGRKGRGLIRRALLGSVSLQVLHSTPRTLLLGPADREVAQEQHDINTILLATDESAYALACANVVADVAKRTGAKVVVLTSYNVSGAGGLAGVATAEIMERLEGDSRRSARDVAERLRSDGVDAEPLVKQASPATAILDVAKARDIDLIALGRRGLHAGERVFLGSTSTRVAQEAETAVLIAAAQDA